MGTKLEKYALIAEIVGALAVVISLIYVGTSVRQNTAVAQVANHQAIVSMDMAKNNWLKDKEFVAIHLKARDGIDKLSTIETEQYMTFVADNLNAWEFAFITYNNGVLEDTIWVGWDRYYRGWTKNKGFQLFWSQGGSNFSPDFNSYVESIIVEPKP
jgi:hypothetical protein